MGAARREPRGVEITERVGKLLPVLYTPSQGKRGKYWRFRPKLDFKIEHTGTAVFGCARPCVLNRMEGGKHCELRKFHQLLLRPKSSAIPVRTGPVERNRVHKDL